MTVRYRRIPQNEPEEIEETNKKMRAERMERISSKLHAFVWILVAVFIIYYTNMVNLLFSDRINRYENINSNSYSVKISILPLILNFSILNFPLLDTR